MSQTAAKFAGTVANDATGTTAWSSPTNAQGSSDATIATSSVTGTNTTQRLKATNFGFTTSDIPAGSTINGFIITVRVRAGTANRAFTSELFVVQGGTTQTGATNLGEGSGSKWANTITSRGYGSASELFGLTWADTDVRASTFGLSLRAAGSNTSTTECAWLSVVVDYTEPGTNYTQTPSEAPSVSDAVAKALASARIEAPSLADITTLAFTATDTPSGTVALTGSAVDDYSAGGVSHDDSPSGVLALAGVLAEDYQPSGAITFDDFPEGQLRIKA